MFVYCGCGGVVDGVVAGAGVVGKVFWVVHFVCWGGGFGGGHFGCGWCVLGFWEWFML